MSVDVLIRGATVYDGTGSPGRQADVAVAGGHIVALGHAATDEPARRVIDGGGLALAPGFIDMHSHGDLTLPSFPDAPNSICQGVTTEVVGNCGFSAAPVPADPALAAELRSFIGGFGPDLDWSWSSYAEFLQRLDQARPAVNVVPLLGHGTLRVGTMGSASHAATEPERSVMRAELRRALSDGAWGMSTGLAYVPGMFADLAELVDVATPLRDVDALYASHIRDEGGELLSAVEEALAVGEHLGIRVQISHLKCVGLDNRGRATGALDRIDAARQRGTRVACDAYPYTAGSTLLSQVLPPWARDGGVDEMLGRLRSADGRMRIRHDLEAGSAAWLNLLSAAGGWANVQVAGVASPGLSWAEGRSIADLARERDADPLDLALDLLLQDSGMTLMVIFLMDEADVRAVLRHPVVAVGSDQLGVTSAVARVHPRAYGTFARMLGWGVRTAGLGTLQEVVRKMTGLPAAIIGLADRGRVAAGMVADLVLFDPTAVADMATYAEPTRLATGIQFVMVGGRLAIGDGRPADLRLGRVLRRG